MHYEYQDFSKSDKKLFQGLVSKAIKNEIRTFLEKTLPIHQTIVETKHDDISKPYWELNDSFKDFSKHLNRRYDDYSHRDLPNMITTFRIEGHLNDQDIAGFSEDGKAKLAQMLEHIKKFRD